MIEALFFSLPNRLYAIFSYNEQKHGKLQIAGALTKFIINSQQVSECACGLHDAHMKSMALICVNRVTCCGNHPVNNISTQYDFDVTKMVIETKTETNE